MFGFEPAVMEARRGTKTVGIPPRGSSDRMRRTSSAGSGGPRSGGLRGAVRGEKGSLGAGF